jgi:hypothetical protein
MVVLQDSMDLLKLEPGSCSETRLTSSHDGCEVTGIKFEEVSDVTEEESQEPMTSPVIKDEPEVRCMPVH